MARTNFVHYKDFERLEKRVVKVEADLLEMTLVAERLLKGIRTNAQASVDRDRILMDALGVLAGVDGGGDE